MSRFLERRIPPADGAGIFLLSLGLSLAAALVFGGILFALVGTSPVTAFATLFGEARPRHAILVPVPDG